MANYARAPAWASEYAREKHVRRQLLQQCRREYKLPLRIAEVLIGALVNTVVGAIPRIFMDEIVIDSFKIVNEYVSTKKRSRYDSMIGCCEGIGRDTYVREKVFFVTVRDSTGREYKCARAIFTGIARPKRSGGEAGGK